MCSTNRVFAAARGPLMSSRAAGQTMPEQRGTHLARRTRGMEAPPATARWGQQSARRRLFGAVHAQALCRQPPGMAAISCSSAAGPMKKLDR